VPLFGGHRYEIIYLDGKAIYLHPRILLRTLRHFIEWRELIVGYVLAVLEEMQPAIVVNYDDGSLIFQTAARRFGKARFLAIQNGSRQLARDNPAGSPRIYLREFACLGRFEVDAFTRHGAQVGTFYPIGSLKDSYYRARREASASGPAEFDLCLVSQFKPAAQFKYSERLDSFEILTEHVKRFCESHDTTVCVGLRKHPDVDPVTYEWEREFFASRLGTLARVFPGVPGEYTTYGLVDRSRVSIGMHTTVLREGFGRGNRVLSCNYTGDPVYNFPVPGPWFSDDQGYEAFERKLLWLLGASEEDYKRACGDAPSYVVAYDSEAPTHLFLQRLIAEAVAGAAEPRSESEVSSV
jgi:surface carbohydrate biosynthesis protein